MHAVTIGCCGWSYPDWKGPFYPAKASARDFLGYYAEHFSIVEVDSTFYRMPTISMIQGWRNKTPAEFRFALKVPQVITHEKLLLDCQKETEEFATALDGLGDKLFCACLQFAFMNHSTFSSQAAFLKWLDPFLTAWPKSIPLAVEIRNKHWMNDELATCLRSHNAAWVLADQAWMPNPLDIVDDVDAVTGPFGYVRLLGHREAVDAATDKFDRIVLDKSADLKRTAESIVRMTGRVPVVAFVNNHYAGHGPETARQLATAVAAGGGRFKK